MTSATDHLRAQEPDSEGDVNFDPLYDSIAREGWPLYQRMEAARGLNLTSDAAADSVLDDWRRAVAPQQESAFAKRLSWAGLTPAQAAWALSPAGDMAPANPDWLPLLLDLQQACRNATTHIEAASNPVPFEDLLQPIADLAVERLTSRLDALAPAFVAQEALQSLSRGLLRDLSGLCTPVLYKLFSDARGAGSTLLADLLVEEGSAPERRIYLEFVHHHLEQGLSEVLQQYPVLGRLLSITVQRWVVNCEQLIRRLAEDMPILSREFCIEEGAILLDATPGLGDPHHGGQTVIALTLGSAPDAAKRVIYKPRGLEIDDAFQQFLRRINELSEGFGFRVLNVVPRDGYGYMEFIEHRLSSDSASLERFYEGAGRLLAVLYLLGCNDCHHENLIACDGELLLIDAETLLQASQVYHETTQAINGGGLNRRLTESVLAVGLLPQWRFISYDGRISALDLSALASSRPDASTYRDYDWAGSNTDSMRWALVEKEWMAPTSVPVKEDEDGLLLLRYRSSLEQGFQRQMESFIHHRMELLAPDGPLAAFKGLCQRVVVRPTQIYSTLAAQACQPEALVSAAARGIILDQLSRKHLTADSKPFDWQIFEEEIRQMEELDIPYFEQPLDGVALLLSQGKIVEDYAQSSGLLACHSRIEALGARDIRFQMELISGSIDARYLQSAKGAGTEVLADRQRETHPGEEIAPHRDKDQRTGEALRIAAEIQRRVIHDQDGSTDWLGLELGRDGERFCFGPLGPSLYSGRSGIAVFFAAAAQHVSGHDPKTAAGLHRDALEAIENLLGVLRSPDEIAVRRLVRDGKLGLSGTGGLMLALLLLEQCGCPPPPETFAGCAFAMARALSADRIRSDNLVDVITGAAGLIGPLLALASSFGEGTEASLLRQLAIVCGERIVEQQQQAGGWVNPAAKKCLTGFSHGASGIVAALARLHRETGLQPFLDAANRGLSYERAQFSVSAANWPDYRKTSEPVLFMNSWCHGAGGIALARLCLRNSALWSDSVEEELRIALESIARAGASGVDHLCCGNLGRAAILNLAAGGDATHRYAARASEIVNRAVSIAASHGGNYSFDSQPQMNTFLPGLFNGYSGVGMHLLSGTNSAVLNRCLAVGLLQAHERDGASLKMSTDEGR